MSNFFNTVHITNFKSLKDVTLSDCKRINLFIGKPNVGKSNILEAIGLFSLPYYNYNAVKKLTQFIRLENFAELFFDGNNEENILIETNTGDSCMVTYRKNSLQPVSFKIESGHIISSNFDASYFFKSFRYVTVNNKFDMIDSSDNEPLLFDVKYYKFAHNSGEKQDNDKINFSYLTPPIGINLIEIIQENKELKKELIALFSEYSLKLLFDKGNNSLRFMKETKDGEVFSMPYSSIADTLQRVIFFKTAIASNKDSILLFEEPEAHCFPPYIAHFTQEVIRSETNQFFIATHSPYVLNDFLETEETRKELAIFIADFKDGQTVINRLTDEEVNEIYEYGIDVFFNYERFTQHDG